VYPRPRILDAGEGGLVVEFSDVVEEKANRAVHALDGALRFRLEAAAGRGAGPGGGFRTIPTYRSLLLLFDPLRLPAEFLLETIGDALGGPAEPGAVSAAGKPAGPPAAAPGRLLEIPVCYSGKWAPELPEVSRLTGLPEDRVVELHAGTEYLVYMLGFQIGYPYMASLPAEIRLPRLERPRLKTQRGAVAIAGELTGIYSIESPGGWRVIGNTPLPLWNLDWDPPALLRPGDRVRFRPITAERHEELSRSGWVPPGSVCPAGPWEEPWGPAPVPSVRVIRPGPLATVQDLGRPGYERYGLGPGGAMDRFALRVGNRLVGNPEGAAAIEVTAGGAEFELLSGNALVWTGGYGDLTLDGRPVPAWTVLRARPGQRLGAGHFRHGFRGYLCLTGGLDVPRVAGSRSTNLNAGFGGFGGRPLRPGDVLPAFGRSGTDDPGEGRAASPDVLAAVYGPLMESEPELRLVPGPQDSAFTGDGLRTFFSSIYRIGPDSNRMGYRLAGPAVATVAGPDIVSDGTLAGAVQVPGNGQPVVLMADHQTTGGYAKLGVVAGADLQPAAQLAPGKGIRFRRTGKADAVRALLEHEHSIGRCTGDLIEFQLRSGGRTARIAVDETRNGQE